MIMITAVIGWLFLVVELLVASPIWVVAHAYAEGEGFAPQQASYGYGAMIGVMARPVALVFGFAFSFYIIGIASWFAAQALGIFLSGMLFNSPRPRA
jgi:conjugal transfer/type IV secretion protein DotA/TraY